jgi:hypothetical protein
MALRLYALNHAGYAGTTIGVTTAQGAWWNSPVASYGKLSLSKSDSNNGGIASSGVTPNVTAGDNLNAKIYLHSWAYLLPTDMYLSGTVDICFPIGFLFDTAVNCNYHWCLHAWVRSASGTGPLIRGTIIDNYSEPSGATNALGESRARQLIAPVSITPLQCRAGDYVIFEVGAVQLAPMITESNITIFHGCKSSGGVVQPDFVSGDLTSYPDPPGATWIEFVAVPTPTPDDVSEPCSATCSGGGTGTVPDPTFPLQPWTPECTGGGDVPLASAPAAAEVW